MSRSSLAVGGADIVGRAVLAGLGDRLETVDLGHQAVVHLGEDPLALHEERHAADDREPDARHGQDRGEDPDARGDRPGRAGHTLIIAPHRRDPARGRAQPGCVIESRSSFSSSCSIVSSPRST